MLTPVVLFCDWLVEVQPGWGVGAGDGDFVVAVHEVVATVFASDDGQVDGAAADRVDAYELSGNRFAGLGVGDCDGLSEVDGGEVFGFAGDWHCVSLDFVPAHFGCAYVPGRW